MCVYIYHILIGRLWPLLFLGDLEFRAYSHGPHSTSALHVDVKSTAVS